MSVAKTRHAFGSKSRVETALANGSIDAYDIVLMEGENNLGELGWVNKQGELVYLDAPKNVKVVTELPETGEADILYVCGTKLYYWSNEAFVTLVNPEASAEQTEELVQEALETALEVVEF